MHILSASLLAGGQPGRFSRSSRCLRLSTKARSASTTAGCRSPTRTSAEAQQRSASGSESSLGLRHLGGGDGQAGRDDAVPSRAIGGHGAAERRPRGIVPIPTRGRADPERRRPAPLGARGVRRLITNRVVQIHRPVASASGGHPSGLAPIHSVELSSFRQTRLTWD
jgi:hypothetical protein